MRYKENWGYEKEYKGNQFYGHNYDHDEEEEYGGIHSNGHNYYDDDNDDDYSFSEGIYKLP